MHSYISSMCSLRTFRSLSLTSLASYLLTARSISFANLRFVVQGVRELVANWGGAALMLKCTYLAMTTALGSAGLKPVEDVMV